MPTILEIKLRVQAILAQYFDGSYYTDDNEIIHNDGDNQPSVGIYTISDDGTTIFVQLSAELKLRFPFAG